MIDKNFDQLENNTTTSIKHFLYQQFLTLISIFSLKLTTVFFAVYN